MHHNEGQPACAHTAGRGRATSTRLQCLEGMPHGSEPNSEVLLGRMPTRVPEPGTKMFWRPPDSISGSLRMLLGSMRRFTMLSLSWRPASRLEASIAVVWVLP